MLVRINLTNLPLVDKDGASFRLLDHLRTLKKTELGEWDVWVPYEDVFLAGRVCALKKSKEATQNARRKALQENSKKGHAVKPETLEAAGYTFVFTTLIEPSAQQRLWKCIEVAGKSKSHSSG